MKTSLINRIIGGVLFIAGVVLVSNPELVSNKPVPTDTFEAVERRIWWGLLIGAGVLLFFRRKIQPWLQTLVATIAALVFGLLVARIIGIGLDGSVIKQWIYVGIEVVILAPLMWWYFRIRVK